MNAFIPSYIGQLLGELDWENPLAAKIHDAAGTRKNDAKSTTVDTVMRVCDCSKHEALALMREYEAIECARFIRGDRRTGNKTRLEWKFSLIAISHAAVAGRGRFAAE